ncbi:hypothetical protein HDA45_002167 [Amycolatopsis umgeniensis]|uniref:Uncharacterized protein n=1 Tax=Amycolatopsis umgeniensis TaxID=336628 RepID=A0A841AZU4_9PSEU|nr:hypothetical protein [Amycolatopsis umgeniensis]MBB5852080.1 hypothetical protein [Amycolatopsis umgeniensis]
MFDEENQEHNNTVWHLSDGPDGAKGGWSSGEDGIDYLMDPEALGGPGTAPKPDPALYGTYAPVQDAVGTVKGKAKAVKQKATKKSKS